jgi:predicted P-loop ATPase
MTDVVSFNDVVRAQWKSRCTLTPKGKLIANVANALMAVRCDPDLRDCYGFDEMAQATVIRREIGGSEDGRDRMATDGDVVHLVEWLQQNGMPLLSNEAARSAMNVVAHEHCFHPVIDYLTSLSWDGVERLGVWLTTYLGAELNAYTGHIGRMFLTSMVARVVSPGCQADHMPVFEGPQGILKSSACRVLGGPWFSDNLPDITSGREASQHLRGKWLVEVAEMHAMSRAEAALLKSFISRTVERYRPSYGRFEVHEKRQCVFAGTTNEDQYLRDATGGRRFWPVKTGITGRISLDLLAENRDQLFAEAVENYNNHGSWWPDQQFERELIKPEQAARYAGDIWEDRIQEWIAGRHRVTVGEIARDCLSIPAGQMRAEHSVRIANVLRDCGWAAKRTGRSRWWEFV